jgi:alpha-1,2-mannosyltransferase
LSHYLSLLRDGDIFTRERAYLWSGGFLIAFVAAILFLAATAHGLNDYKNRPLGTDFSCFYAAGTLVLDGAPEAAFDPARLDEQNRATFGHAAPSYGWFYPPFLLPVVGALAALPYLPALILWQAATLALYLAALALLLQRWPQIARDRIWLLLALAFPAVFVNLTHGQYGFLTAALLAGALALLDKRPIVAGILFGLMAYKPQFGILIPLVLVVSARWRCLAAASATVAALVLLATLMFGADIWSAFFASAHFSRTVVLEQGGPGFEKIQSAFALVRLWGGSADAGYAVQILVTVGVAAALEILWRSQASAACKGAGLCLGVLLATPYCVDYDMMLLAPAIALLAADGVTRGFLPYERTTLAALWLVPIVARGAAGLAHIPLGLIVMILAFAFVVRRGVRQTIPALA